MHFTQEAQNFVRPCLTEGSIAIDATCGNGFDTLFLAANVGNSGVVFGVDIQSRSIETVQRKLVEAGTLSRCRLFVGSHSSLSTIVDSSHAGAVSAAMFNLGYLPLGDKAIVTQPETTVAGLQQAFDLIRSGGRISVLAYPGHIGGVEETTRVTDWAEHRKSDSDVDKFQDPNNGNSPVLWVITKR